MLAVIVNANKHDLAYEQNFVSCRNDFLKVGEELELAKGRGSEEYCKVVDMLRGMYVQVGKVSFLLNFCDKLDMLNCCVKSLLLFPFASLLLHFHRVSLV